MLELIDFNKLIDEIAENCNKQGSIRVDEAKKKTKLLKEILYMGAND